MVVHNFQSSMWKSNYVAISLLVIALTTVNFAESRRWSGGRRISSGSAHKKHVSNQHVNPVDLSYGGGHASAPKPTYTGGSHGYPSSGGLSGSNAGSGSHGYPSSGGLSGTNTGGGSHGYPSSGGLSGSNTGGGSHTYPSSNGLSGTNTGNYGPSNIQNTHVNPVNSANPSNSHNYPSSNGGISGNNNNYAYPASNGLSGHSSNNQPLPNSPSSYPNNHFQPNYHVNSVNSAPYGGHPMPYPPYQGPPPMYVQNIQNSGSRFGDILTGLAIYNLAQSAANSFSSSKHKSNDNVNGKPNSATTADMACILKIIGENKTEAVKVPCDIVSSFITSNSSVTNTTEKTSNASTIANATNTGDKITNSVVTNATNLVNVTATDVNTTSTASLLSTNSTPSMPITTESATAQNVSSSNESVVTNSSTAVPNDPNKADNTTPQPTVTTISEGSETTTPMTLPETTPSTLINMTVTVPQNVTHNQNSSEGNAAVALITTANTPLSTNITTIMPTNESTVSTTTSAPNENEKNSSNIHNAVDPIAVKGPNIEVKPDYECVIEVYKNRIVTSNKVPCALLLQYAFQGTTTTVRPTSAPRASPNGSLSSFANNEKLSALCLVFFWVRYNLI